MTDVIFSCPAYDVVVGPFERYAANPVVTLKAGDQVACLGLGYSKDLYKMFGVDSVVSYALKSDHCPIEAVERAKAYGHELHFLFGHSVSITSHKRPRETYISVTIGQVVKFEGRYFEVVKTGYEHLGLKEVPH